MEDSMTFDFEWWHLLFLIVAALLESLVHETSHAIVAKSLGYVRVRIHPFRLRVAGRWAFGGFSYKYLSRHPDESRMWFAPVLGANLVFFAGVVIAVLTRNTIPFAFSICALVDLVFWLKGYWRGSPDHDGQKYRRTE